MCDLIWATKYMPET